MQKIPDLKFTSVRKIFVRVLVLGVVAVTGGK